MADIQAQVGTIFSQVMGSALIVAYVLGGAVLLFLLWWFIIRPRSYKFMVTINQERAGGIVRGFDHGKITVGKGGLFGFFQKDNIRRFKLLKRGGLELPVPELKHFIRTDVGDAVDYYRYGQTDYEPVVFSELTEKFKELKFQPSDEDIKLWHIEQSKDIIRRNTQEDKVMKILVPLMIGFIIIGLIVSTYIIAGALKQSSSDNRGIAEASKEMALATKETANAIRDVFGITQASKKSENPGLPVTPTIPPG